MACLTKRILTVCIFWPKTMITTQSGSESIAKKRCFFLKEISSINPTKQSLLSKTLTIDSTWAQCDQNDQGRLNNDCGWLLGQKTSWLEKRLQPKCQIGPMTLIIASHIYFHYFWIHVFVTKTPIGVCKYCYNFANLQKKSWKTHSDWS